MKKAADNPEADSSYDYAWRCWRSEGVKRWARDVGMAALTLVAVLLFYGAPAAGDYRSYVAAVVGACALEAVVFLWYLATAASKQRDHLREELRLLRSEARSLTREMAAIVETKDLALAVRANESEQREGDEEVARQLQEDNARLSASLEAAKEDLAGLLDRRMKMAHQARAVMELVLSRAQDLAMLGVNQDGADRVARHLSSVIALAFVGGALVNLRDASEQLIRWMPGGPRFDALHLGVVRDILERIGPDDVNQDFDAASWIERIRDGDPF